MAFEACIFSSQRARDQEMTVVQSEVAVWEPQRNWLVVKLVHRAVAPTYGAARRNGRYRSARRDSSGKISHVVDPKALERMLERLSPHLDGRRS